MGKVPYYTDPPSYDVFLRDHLHANVPAVLGPKLIAHWPARKHWIRPLDHRSSSSQDDGSMQPASEPDYAYLRHAFADTEVQVAVCDERDFTDQKRVTMAFGEFVDHWERGSQDGSQYYLKDWHFAKTAHGSQAYTVPDLFADDWMNEYWMQNTDDDYRFSYMGGDGSFTPLHADVYRSYSWSCNICGIKKWTLFSPDQEPLLKDKLGNLVYDVRHVDPQQFPQFAKTRPIVLYQRDGETVFIPSNWFHQVENMGATISINHNWMNATNIETCFASLCRDLDDVERSLEDVQASMDAAEFTSTCQHVLLLHSGWNWRTLHELLACIQRRLLLYDSHDGGDDAALARQPPVAWQLDLIASLQACLAKYPHFAAYVATE